MECEKVNQEGMHEEAETLSQTDVATVSTEKECQSSKDLPLNEETETCVSEQEKSVTSNSVCDQIQNADNNNFKSDDASPLTAPVAKTPGRPGRKRKREIYNKNDDPDTIREKRKKRAVELKLKNLKWTLNQPTEVSGKRQKKVPQRFELAPVDKRKSCMDDCQGYGEPLGNIEWINQRLRVASIYTLRLLHRTIYRKQGMFSEKHIRKSVVKFSGFPFDGTHPEIARRREQLERANVNALSSLCDLLAIRRASKEVMIDKIISFLLHPTQKSVDEFLKGVVYDQQSKSILSKAVFSPFERSIQQQDPLCQFLMHSQDQDNLKDPQHISQDEEIESYDFGADFSNAPWKKPAYFTEGNGVKLKYIRAIASNIQAASDTFIELLYRLLYLDVDEKHNMRQSILEFSGLKCEVGTSNYIYRMRILSVLPMEQVKLICRVLCLPTWHRSRQLLSEGIMDFLAAPRISVMKKRVPPHFSDEITFSFDGAKTNKVRIPELKSADTEEIEIVPDIHIPDDTSASLGSDFTIENEYLGVKLKNFSNIHYQVITTPAVKLNDVHMILYLTTSAQNNIRRNVLEFSGFPFDESSSEYHCRRSLMEKMSLEDLKTVATVLCVSQYIVDESKCSLIDAVLKFLLKPSALLNSSTIMPTISPAPVSRKTSVVKKKATSTSKTPQLREIIPEIVISEIRNISSDKEATAPTSNAAVSCSTVTITEEEQPEIEIVKASLSTSIEITPIPQDNVKVEHPPETDEPLSKVKKEVTIIPARVSYFGSDDEDDQPLSKMIGHPNDDQLRVLVTKIVKESKLEEITMKHVIRKVFETYPNFDLGYRKEFIKSIVRQILSQMDDQSCSVSTTVITI